MRYQQLWESVQSVVVKRHRSKMVDVEMVGSKVEALPAVDFRLQHRQTYPAGPETRYNSRDIIGGI